MTESPDTEGTLSFFQVASDEELSDSDCSENEEAVKSEEVVPEKQRSSVLPSPLCVLADAKTPEFVTSHLSSDLKWDKMVKKAPYIAPKEFKPWENDLPAFESKSNVKDSKPDIASCETLLYTFEYGSTMLRLNPPLLNPKK
uniref:UPF0690 protein C1orf52 homolog B-like n=1 Tax=Ciona intestinalis TaxID=7719 RepID=UPI00052126A1|nr:UPF0690 protein C1orf52 homolog B-like [Ciona intestinalis]|eukprot:XP_009858503.1 UPF0690 protein C1orf52 homolog B-like [Ciona intestinalis]